MAIHDIKHTKHFRTPSQGLNSTSGVIPCFCQVTALQEFFSPLSQGHPPTVVFGWDGAKVR